MDANGNISAAVFAAYQKCSTKAYLMVHGEKSPDSVFADTRGCIAAEYKARVSQNLGFGSTNKVVSFDHLRLTGVSAECMSTLLVDCETTSYGCDLPVPVRVGSQAERSDPGHGYVPVAFSAWNKRDRSDDLLVCFGAMAIQQAIGGEIPSCGKVIYGEGYCGRTVKIADHLPKTRQIVEAVASASLDREPPPLVLNKHCAICDFQTRCRAVAVERENLSLLGAMTAKERSQNGEKGISTITQLSYGYRPRRRRRIKSTAPRASPPVKHDHKLKALAIKKAQTHVVVLQRYRSKGCQFSWTLRVFLTGTIITSLALDTKRKAFLLRSPFGPTGRKASAKSGGNACAPSSWSKNRRLCITAHMKAAFSKP